MTTKAELTLDTECYANYWLCHFEDGTYFEMFDGQPLDIVGLSSKLRETLCVTFNGNNYDMPLICLALMGASTYDLKAASDRIIMENLRGWQIQRTFDWIDHIDLFEVAPGQGSLKAYGGKMHSRRLMDLPLPPDSLIEPHQRELIRERYCHQVDLPITRDLRNAMQAQIALRVDMSAEYGIDLRSKSDAQIAEAAMKSVLGYKPEAPYVAPGTQFYYRPPEWLRYASPQLQSVLHRIANVPFWINPSGGVSPDYDQTLIDWGKDQVRQRADGAWVKRTADFKHEPVRIGNTLYAVGIGGLHSMESAVCHVTDAQYEITDHDVASYYPSLILRTGIFPQQIGPRFAGIYEGWYRSRLAAKRAGEKKKANSLKTLLNGTFGKLGNVYSIFYAPSEMIQVTVTGQLALLMLIEMLEMCGVSVISANTDGIILKTPRHLAAQRDAILHWWEQQTGFETERTDYRVLAQADVNSYCAIQPDGTVKLKGRLAPPEPGASGWPNPTGQVCVDAVVAYLKDGTPLEATIRACQDVRQFLHVRAVKGGGSWVPDGNLQPSTKVTQKFMREVTGLPPDVPKQLLAGAYDAMVEANHARRQYLGKVVRWYYVKGCHGCIVTPQGGQVAKAEGCRPLMDLPDALPADVDYDKYVADARALLAEIGVTSPTRG